MRIGKVATVAVVATLGMAVVGGCTTIEEKYNLSKRTQIVAAGGAVGGGVISAVAGASTAWIAASVFLGGVAGGVISELLGDDDKEKQARAGTDALENQGTGGQTAWRNPASGNGGATTIDESFVKADGTPCKRFTQTITADGQTHRVAGTACRQADGTWMVAAS